MSPKTPPKKSGNSKETTFVWSGDVKSFSFEFNVERSQIESIKNKAIHFREMYLYLYGIVNMKNSDLSFPIKMHHAIELLNHSESLMKEYRKKLSEYEAKNNK